MKIHHILAAACLVAAGLSAACTRAVVYKESSPKPVVVQEDEHGPPDHAPAYGYRRNHAGDDVVLVYDAGIDVYVVKGYDNCYYSSGQYFRFMDGQWEWSVSVESGWRIVEHISDVPPGLRHKHGDGHGHGHGHGHHRD